MKLFFVILLVIFSSLGAGSETGFLFFGDAGTGSKNQMNVAQAMTNFCENAKCDFVTLLGDNFYPSGVADTRDPLWKEAFEIPYSPLNIPFFALLGNHDYKGNVEAQINYSKKSKQWKMPSRYYTFSRGPVDFFVLDTNKFNKPQREWLSETLDASKKTWKIVCGHHPIYSYGDHGNSEELKDELLPIIEGKVDFYLSGHDHNKQVIEKNSSDITFIVSGAAGQTKPLNKNRSLLFGSDKLGFGHFLISDKKATLMILDRNGTPEYTQSFE
jgi:DNA repair exonuclease SbcCD nuclease subunit